MAKTWLYFPDAILIIGIVTDIFGNSKPSFRGFLKEALISGKKCEKNMTDRADKRRFCFRRNFYRVRE